MIKNCKECGRSIGTLFDDPNPKAQYCQAKCKQKAYRRRMRESGAVTRKSGRYGWVRSGSTEHISTIIRRVGASDEQSE